MARSIAVTAAAAELRRIERLAHALRPFGTPALTPADVQRAREIVGLTAKELRP